MASHLERRHEVGALAFGIPEYMKAVLVGGQLARRYGLPHHSSNAHHRHHGGCPGRLRVGATLPVVMEGQRREARRRLASRRSSPPSRRWCWMPTCCRWWPSSWTSKSATPPWRSTRSEVGCAAFFWTSPHAGAASAPRLCSHGLRLAQRELALRRYPDACDRAAGLVTRLRPSTSSRRSTPGSARWARRLRGEADRGRRRTERVLGPRPGRVLGRSSDVIRITDRGSSRG